MTAGHSRKHVSWILILTAVLLLLSVGGVWLTFAGLKHDAYRKIQPLAVEVSLSATQPVELALQYDYGRNYHPAHTQQRFIGRSDAQQNFSFSISEWKTVQRLRLQAPMEFSISAINLTKGGNMVRVLDLDTVRNGGVYSVSIDNIPGLFAGQRDRS